MLDLASRSCSNGVYEARTKKAKLHLKHGMTAGLENNNVNIQGGDLVVNGNPGSRHQPRAHIVGQEVLKYEDSALIRDPPNIRHVFVNSYANPPWLPQDQPDETLGVRIQGYPHHIQALEDGDTWTNETEASTDHQPISEWVEIEPVNPPASDVKQTEVRQARPRLNWRYSWEDHQQERLNLLGPDIDQERKESTLSVQTAYTWPPRRLSAKDYSQMEVPLIPGQIQTINQYFDENAPLNLRRGNGLTTATSHVQVLASELADPIPHATNTGHSQAVPVISENSEQQHLHAWANSSQNVVISEPGSLTKTQLTSHTQDLTNTKRSSARQQSRPKVDYRNLDSRGKPVKH